MALAHPWPVLVWVIAFDSDSGHSTGTESGVGYRPFWNTIAPKVRNSTMAYMAGPWCRTA